MARVERRLRHAVAREMPTWGVEPVPSGLRTLTGLDLGVLWGDLAVGLLVLLTGALLVPALGTRTALVAIAVGSLIGCVPLALAGLAGAREGVPGMVLFRPVLGLRGSYVPSALNVLQLVGWTGFELWTMSEVANRISTRLFHFSSYWVWLAVVAVVCTALALAGPIVLVRQWLEKFGAWVVVAVGVWVSARVLSAGNVGQLWQSAGHGGLGFWLGVDLVIAQPVSWLPLVADYTRFARSGRGAAAGTFAGYAVGNAWFYALGALLALSARISLATPAALGAAIAAIAGGWVVLLSLLVGETDEAFADIYSAAISVQNVRPRLPQRRLVLGIAAAGTVLAAWLGLRPAVATGEFEAFLFLLGSVFVPLFGVFVADYFVLRGRRAGYGGPIGRHPAWRPAAIAAWGVGFLVYQWSVPTGPAAWQTAIRTALHAWLHLPFPLWGSAAGASVPSFAVAFVMHLALSAAVGRPAPARVSR